MLRLNLVKTFIFFLSLPLLILLILNSLVLFNNSQVLAQQKSIRVPILMYHYIGNNPNPKDLQRDALSVPADKFDAQMGYLSSNGYTPISMDTLYAGLFGHTTLAPNPVVLTFDDGYIDFYHNAYPILRKYNFPAVVFLPTGLIDQGYYLYWNQVKEMNASGLISFQSHTVTHPNLNSLNAASLNYQLKESKKVLETVLGKPVNTLAYPYGISNATVRSEAQKVGYIGAVGTWYGKTSSLGNLMNLPRVKIGGNFSIEDFAKRL